MMTVSAMMNVTISAEMICPFSLRECHDKSEWLSLVLEAHGTCL
jgi:hypothetical protein